jgi:hypothetical protein
VPSAPSINSAIVRIGAPGIPWLPAVSVITLTESNVFAIIYSFIWVGLQDALALALPGP